MIPQTDSICPICSNERDNKFLNVLEMMLQTYDTFRYLECANCGALSLSTKPDDMSRYYPSSYYSFTKETTVYTDSLLEKLKYTLRKSSMKAHLGEGTFIDILVNKMKPIYYPWLKKYIVSLDSKILDVGCGNGFLITEMQQYGFSALYGIDLFVKDSVREDALKIYKMDIHTFDENDFDFIMYNHSFEHIENPHLELQSIYNRLSDRGTLMIRVPICDSYAFRKYKENWVQLDAPRHYFLYTRKSMEILASKNNFELYDFMYDSNAFQFVGSECYQRNIPLSKWKDIFSKSELKKWEDKAKKLNQVKDGDSICFYLRKIAG